MNELQINTTQNVKLNFTAASVGERMLAFILDFIIFVIYWWFINFIVKAGDFVENFDSWSQRALWFLIFIPVTFYTLVLESVFEGQTVGKKILSIKVVKLDGFQTTFLDFLIRWFFRMIDIYLVLIIIIVTQYNLALAVSSLLLSPLIGLLALIINKNTQRIGDIVAGTAVISLKNKVNISHTILETLKEDYVPTYPKVIQLSDNDARIIKETFMMARKNKDYAVLIKLRTKIEEVTGIKNQEKNDAIFVDKVLKDYNYYTQNM